MIKTDGINKLAEFGQGTIRITSAYINEKGVMALNTNDYVPIGESAPLTGTMEEKIEIIQNSEIQMTFDNVESLEVLILKLQEIRAMMLGVDIQKFEMWKERQNITTLYYANPFIDMIFDREE